MKIKRITLHNFKCHKEREIDFFNGITQICGMNSVGKTSVFDAYLWTLFDRNAEGTNNPVVRPKDSDGEFIENVDVSVELTVIVDGDEHTVKKTQKRLSNGKGNKNEYEIDGHPMTKREFNEFILNLLNVGDDFDLLSDPNALMKQHWEKIREKITSTVDSISDVDIAKMYGEKYSIIIPELKNFKTDDILKKHKRAKSDLVDKQNELKIRIDEASKRIVIADVGALKVEKAAKEAELSKVEADLSGGNGKTGEINSKREEIMNLKFHLSEIQNEANRKLLDDSSGIREEVAKKREVAENLKRELSELRSSGRTVHAEYQAHENDVKRLLDEWKIEKAKAFPEFVPLEPLSESATVCPTCGQELPEDVKKKNIADYEARKKAHEDDYNKRKADFETEHNKKLADITKAGSEAAKLRDEAKEKLETFGRSARTYEQKIEEAQRAYGEEKEKLDKFPKVADVSGNEEYRATNEKISALEKEINELASEATDKTEIEAKKSILKDEIAEIAGKIMAADNTKVKADIAEYEEKVVETGQNMAKEDHFIALTEDFVRAKMNMISDKINALFKLVKWKLFQNLENGGMRETCVCTVNGIDYPEVNAGHKILAGLDIIDTLSGLCGARLPIFIDSAGELNTFNLPKMENQIILLKVTDDKELKVAEG